MNTLQTPALFPILQPEPVSGLARLAAEARHVGDGHLVEFRAMEVRSVLNRSVSRRQLSLAYSINPYRGCEFGCRYCYARYTHEFLAPSDPTKSAANLRDPEMFERLIFLKENAAWLLEQELKKIDPSQEIALGTATDPYQPAERTARITRSILQVFARRTGYRLGIVTKSRLILRDIDLLTEISRKNHLVVHLTITTPDAALARLLEPRAPRPDLRLEAVLRLRRAGITAGILCSPLLPGITDDEAAINRMAKLAAEANASFFAAEPLFLKSCSRPTFLSFVREHFPALVADYESRFATRDFADQSYRRTLAERVRAACRKHGVSPRSTDALLTRDVGKRRPTPAGGVAQARLFA
jgi:DNA repair photolyase